MRNSRTAVHMNGSYGKGDYLCVEAQEIVDDRRSIGVDKIVKFYAGLWELLSVAVNPQPVINDANSLVLIEIRITGLKMRKLSSPHFPWLLQNTSSFCVILMAEPTQH